MKQAADQNTELCLLVQNSLRSNAKPTTIARCDNRLGGDGEDRRVTKWLGVAWGLYGGQHQCVEKLHAGDAMVDGGIGFGLCMERDGV